MRHIRFIIAGLLLVITLISPAQKREKQSIVLNDGTVIAGTVIADSSEFLVVRIKSPQVITLGKSQVYSTGNVRTEDKYSYDKKGYSMRLSASVLAGQNKYGKTSSLSFHLSNGYQFRNGLSIGAGTGIEELDVTVMPVYADLRFQPFKTRISPFAWVKSGYGFPLNDRTGEEHYYYGYYPDSKGGIMFCAGAGVALCSWKHNAVSFGIGYRHQRLSFNQQYIWNEEINNALVTYFNRIEVQFGFIFR